MDDRYAELLSQVLRRLDRLEHTVTVGLSQVIEQNERLLERISEQQAEMDAQAQEIENLNRRVRDIESLLGSSRK